MVCGVNARSKTFPVIARHSKRTLINFKRCKAYIYRLLTEYPLLWKMLLQWKKVKYWLREHIDDILEKRCNMRSQSESALCTALQFQTLRNWSLSVLRKKIMFLCKDQNISNIFAPLPMCDVKLLLKNKKVQTRSKVQVFALGVFKL